ncbi:MAG: GTPase HflX [Nitrospirae bacterium]|nr:GTPase HflX [Nitrospirota bacterium]
MTGKGGLPISTVYGNLTGLNKQTVYDLERIYRRKVPPDQLITRELAAFLCEISASINRQIGVLITRGGTISHVIAGDASGLIIPALGSYPLGRKPMRGLRLVHTHLKNEPLSNDDLNDLAILRLDYMAAIGIKNGLPDKLYGAHLVPQPGVLPYEVSDGISLYALDLAFDSFVRGLEDEMERERLSKGDATREQAILVSVSNAPRYEQEDSLSELEELAYSADIIVLDKTMQRMKEINPKYLLGTGKARELVIEALGKGATLLVFDQNLSPSQSRSITELTELKVIDRTQLILDIFARRAHSRDGKVQVELAQLKYRLPRLSGKGTAMSRLMGGIGGRGPGEMKLEIDKRRVRDRINLLEKELEKLSRARDERKRRRVKLGIPIVSIVGYTNAGKSTLLNNLTRSATAVEDKMFATLDTASRRLRFPHEREVIVTDTVGFIRDLPEDLSAAFKATLEELSDADLLLHVVDLSNDRFEQQIASVGNILSQLGLDSKPQLMAFNKIDLVDPGEAANVVAHYSNPDESYAHGAVALCAMDQSTFGPLLEAIGERLFTPRLLGTQSDIKLQSNE